MLRDTLLAPIFFIRAALEGLGQRIRQALPPIRFPKRANWKQRAIVRRQRLNTLEQAGWRFVQQRQVYEQRIQNLCDLLEDYKFALQLTEASQHGGF